MSGARSFCMPDPGRAPAAACTPTLDWREVRPEASGLVALFPCKPDRHARRAVAGVCGRLTLLRAAPAA